MENRPVIIIGSGLAGYTLAREFRKLDAVTPLLILSRDHGGFYSKPMLSNALAQKRSPASLLMKTAAQMADELKAVVMNQVEVTAIDPDAKVVTADGNTIAYRQLVLATGANPLRLPLQGNGAADVMSVNDLDDYQQFRTRLEGTRHVLILGAGLIGCEFANDLVGAGFQVTVVDLAPQLLGRLLPGEVAEFMKRRLERAGVSFALGASIRSIDRRELGYQVTLSSGEVVSTELILSAIGLQPRTDLAKLSGLAVSRGIIVDQFMQTSRPDVYALGDCAESSNGVLPFVMPIMTAARALARTLTGDRREVSYPLMPITVKTPACPAAIAPPAYGVKGSWQSELVSDGYRALFTGDNGQVSGFALAGAAVAEKAAVAGLVSRI